MPADRQTLVNRIAVSRRVAPGLRRAVRPLDGAANSVRIASIARTIAALALCGASTLLGPSCSSEADPGGSGSPQCESGLQACSGACVDVRVNGDHCGECGRACSGGTVCSVGVCSASCGAGLTACGTACVALATSAQNCGRCGAACAVGQSCSSGVCSSVGAGEAGSPDGAGEDAGAAMRDAAAATGDAASATSGAGLRVGSMCYPVCLSAITDTDLDGYGFEAGRSCVVRGAAPAVGAVACVPPAPVVAEMAGGDGFYLGGVCHARCASSATDPDTAGVVDGYGYENGRTCVVAGSGAAMQAVACVPPAGTVGDGFLVANECVGACLHPELADAAGYGYEAQRTCVVTGSTGALQNARCQVQARQLPMPGTGSLLGETCFPPCGANALDITAPGYGWDMNRTCVVPGSTAVIQGVPCVPPASTLTGECPRTLACPVVNGVTLLCGCTWIDGLRARKVAIMATAGATQYFVAAAMMETAPLTSDYLLGDGKSNDAFNAGIAKQNWGMTRRCHPAWNALTEAQFSTSIAMNADLALDIQVYNECRTRFGNDWWSGHRNGFGSLGSTSTDIQQFKGAMDWTNTMLTGHLADDVRFWVMIQPI